MVNRANRYLWIFVLFLLYFIYFTFINCIFFKSLFFETSDIVSFFRFKLYANCIRSSSDKYHRLTFVSSMVSFVWCCGIIDVIMHEWRLRMDYPILGRLIQDVFSDSDNWGHISTRNVKPPVRILNVSWVYFCPVYLQYT